MSSYENNYLKAFGESLKRQRECINKSLRLLAYEAGVPRSTLSRLENGQRVPNIITLKKLAFVFNMTLSEFIDKIENEIPDFIKNFDI